MSIEPGFLEQRAADTDPMTCAALTMRVLMWRPGGTAVPGRPGKRAAERAGDDDAEDDGEHDEGAARCKPVRRCHT